MQNGCFCVSVMCVLLTCSYAKGNCNSKEAMGIPQEVNSDFEIAYTYSVRFVVRCLQCMLTEIRTGEFHRELANQKSKQIHFLLIVYLFIHKFNHLWEFGYNLFIMLEGTRRTETSLYSPAKKHILLSCLFFIYIIQ